MKGKLGIFAGLIFICIIGWLVINKLELNDASKCPVSEEIKTVRGSSLEPLVPSGSEIKALLGYYNCHEIKRNDLILYHYAGNKVPLIKIVKGIPQDTFKLVLKDSSIYNLYINGKIITNSQRIPYTFSGRQYKMLSLYVKDYKEVIPPNAYLLLGNQVNGSVDARVFGLVDKAEILGKAVIKK